MPQAVDSRFFAGYHWVSDSPDCKTGLCIPADSHEGAADRFLAQYVKFWNRGRTFSAYVMAHADDVPQRFTLSVDADLPAY